MRRLVTAAFAAVLVAGCGGQQRSEPGPGATGPSATGTTPADASPPPAVRIGA